MGDTMLEVFGLRALLPGVSPRARPARAHMAQ